MSEREQFLAEVEDFLRRTGMAPSSFGWKAKNDGTLVKRLRQGLDLRLSSVERIRAFMRAYEREHSDAA